MEKHIFINSIISRLYKTDERENLACRSAAFEILHNNFEYMEVDHIKNCLTCNIYVVEVLRIFDIEK